MKNAIILHGTDGKSTDDWFPWLKSEMEGRGYKVWVPDLPGANEPSIKRYNEFLLSQGWEFDSETVLIGHSSGAVSVLGLLEALPEGVQIDTAILVGAFEGDLNWPGLKNFYEKPFDFEKLKSRAQHFVLVHSDNDPYCPLEHAKSLAQKLNGELIVRPGEAHFSTSTAGDKYRAFPFLLEVLRV